MKMFAASDKIGSESVRISSMGAFCSTGFSQWNFAHGNLKPPGQKPVLLNLNSIACLSPAEFRVILCCPIPSPER